MLTNLQYNNKTDEELVAEAKNGDSLAVNFLLNKYTNFVKAKTSPYFLVGADREDIIQEGMIGFYKAIRDYRKSEQLPFHSFAGFCIKRQVFTALKNAMRKKHNPINSYVSFNKPICDKDSSKTVLDILPDNNITNPEKEVIDKENHNNIRKKMNELANDLEWEILALYLDGASYQEIATDLNRNIKSVDNALQRVRRKLKRCPELICG